MYGFEAASRRRYCVSSIRGLPFWSLPCGMRAIVAVTVGCSVRSNLGGTGIADFYPDVTNAGSLTKLLRTEMLRRVNASGCTFLKETVAVRSPYWAFCKTAHRDGDIVCASDERLFLASFWERGVELARVQTTLLDELADALLAWFVGANSASVFQGLIANACILDHAAAYEAGAEVYVEYRWSQLLSDSMRAPGFAELVNAAAKLPELRRLLPFTSHDWLCFSRCTGYPFTMVCPSIGPLAVGTYHVKGVDQRSLGTADLDKALEIVVSNLPHGVGPATHGRAHDLNLPGR
jgi:hypothetical protein